MEIKAIVRILVGISFIAGGAVKTRRFGKLISPEHHRDMTELYKKGYELYPLKQYFDISATTYQELIGYTDIFCGFLLVSGLLVAVSCVTLMANMSRFLFVLYKLEQPVQNFAPPVVAFLSLLFIFFTSHKKPKQD